MKKLMLAAAVIAAGVALADVEGNNIVGYRGIATENHEAPIVGAVFFEVGGDGETYDLSMLHINDIYDENGDLEDYPDPYSEYLRVLHPNSTKTEHEYCYVSAGYLEDNVNDPEESQWAIGWWKHQKGANYTALINEGNGELKISSPVPFTNGQGFMGNFATGHTLDLVSDGEVPLVVTKIETDRNEAPLIVNYLPVDIVLSDITIADILDEGGELEDYPDPYSEYLRALHPNSTKTEHEYCYVSAGYLEDNVNDPEESQWAIGWWKHQKGANYTALINEGNGELKIAESIDVPSGRGFMGNFAQGHSLSILFPGATTVPSKQ